MTSARQAAASELEKARPDQTMDGLCVGLQDEMPADEKLEKFSIPFLG